MLDSLKGLAGGGKAQKQVDDLHSLITAAKEERSALSAMLTQISMRSSKLSQMGKSLEQIEQKAVSAGEKLDEVTRRLEGVEGRAKAFGDVEKRVHSLIEAATQAQAAAEKLMAPDGDLQAHRRQVQQLASQSLETQASVEAIKKERATLEEFRNQLRQAQTEIKSSVDNAATLRGELDQVRGTAGQLSQDYTRLRDTLRGAKDDSMAATEAVKDVEKKLGPLMQLQELSKSTEEKLTSLNALAEHVTQKAKALEGQKHTIDRAVVEANRLNEMVWSMDVQIGKLNEGLKQAARGEESIAAHREDRRRDQREGRSGEQGARRVRARSGADGEGRPRARRRHAVLRREAGSREEGVRGVRPSAPRPAHVGDRGREPHGRALRQGEAPLAPQPAHRCA